MAGETQRGSPGGDALAAALADAGGVRAGADTRARLERLLAERLERGERELAAARSGRDLAVAVAFAAGDRALAAVAPVDARFRSDPARATERGWLLLAATVGALVEAAAGACAGLRLETASFGSRWLALVHPGGGDAELAALAFEEHAEPVDRLRAAALAVPAHLLEPLEDRRPPIGAGHPLRVAEAVARLGGRPADPAAVEAHEDAVLRLVGSAAGPVRPHEDPIPERRIARRILQRLAGMGKWGGYHTEVSHLARGFEGNDRGLALEIGERLVDAGLLVAKTSVGQRHVFLNPRRAGDVHALIDDGSVPAELDLG